jgi:hypothetical protein
VWEVISLGEASRWLAPNIVDDWQSARFFDLQGFLNLVGLGGIICDLCSRDRNDIFFMTLE